MPNAKPSIATTASTACCRVDPVVRFLSFGAGVQSSVMLMLAIRGEIERPDHVIWADTGFEARRVYAHVDWAERQCQKAGIPFHRVRAKRTLKESFEEFERGDTKYWNARPPLFIENSGQLRRQCTREVKIEPILRAQKKLLGHKTSRTIPDGACAVMVGISIDEARRAAPSPERWYDREYPLIDPLKMSRIDCQAWWDREYPHIALPSSSCTICPYMSPAMRRRQRQNAPDDHAEAVEYDGRIRSAYKERTGQTLYISDRRRPIAEVSQDSGQSELDLDDGIYCSGGCGL